MDLMPPSSGGISEEASGEEEPRESETDESPPQETVEEVRTISNTVKVHIGKLDAVMGVLGELSLVRTSLWSQAMDILSREGMGETGASLVKQVRTMERKLKELQRAIVEIRMVPIGQIFNRLNRTARQLARNSGKEISVHLYGGETELDKVMMEEMLSPLVHIIRNSIDHGLESPTERLKENKQPTGNLVIAAYQKGNSIVIEVTDDGRGIQYDRILSTALEKGLVDDQAALSKEELMELIFLPGFSSAEKVTEVSGRGVGLDAVKDAIEGLKGSIGVWSEPNEGTTFQITLPITLAIIQSLIVDSCDQFYAIPISSILETIRLTEKEIQFVDQREVFDLRGTTLPLLRLEERFWQYRRERQEGDQLFVVVVRRGERMAGIVVDSLRGEQETVVHPLGERLSRIPGIAGATEIGENQVILVIDTASLFATSETVHV